MCSRLLQRLVVVGRTAAQTLRRRPLAATTAPAALLVAGALADMARSKPALIAEPAFLRRQLIGLRGARRPRCTPADRALPVLLAKGVAAWRRALPLVQPDTPLRWHRRLFRRSWRRRSRAAAPAHRPPLAPETVAPIREVEGAIAARTQGRALISAEPPRAVARGQPAARRAPSASGSSGGAKW